MCAKGITIDQFLLRLLSTKILQILHIFNKTVGKDLESIYAREDELLGSDTLSSPPRLCTDTSSSQNSSRYRNVSSKLAGDDYEILNILKEMLQGSKESESVIP